MPLRNTQQADLREIMHDTDSGGIECSITSPSGASETFMVFHSDIHEMVDPGTGAVFSGRRVRVSLVISDLIAAGFGGIRGVEQSDATPWIVTVSDANGVIGTFKVAKTLPSNSLGMMPIELEVYE